MYKRLIALLLAGIMALSLFGCDSSNTSGNDSTGSTSEDTTPVETTEAQLTAQPIEIAKSIGGNPIAGFDDEGNLTYGGDPSVLVDGDTVYLYVGHDTATTESYVIPEYLCYSTQDLVNWTYEGVVLSMKDVDWADNNSAWAGQVVKHYDEASGKDMYYMYYCSWNKYDSGIQSIGVAVSGSPTGTFVDIGEALILGSFTTYASGDSTGSTWNDIDPTVWIENDENGEEHIYLCWGNTKLFMCELNSDMVSVKDYDGDGEITFGGDVLSQKQPSAFTEGPWLYRRQDENGDYYGDYYIFYASSWREHLAYATCDDLMEGNWIYGDIIMDPTATSNTNHPAVFDFQGETYMIYHNGSLSNGSGFRRVACIARVEFFSDGSVDYIEELSTGLNGTASTLTALNGEVLAHQHYANSSSDTEYPYLNVTLGSGLDKTKDEDTYWEIVAGKLDEENVYYVSLEAVNKPGLYITAGEGTVALSQDSAGIYADIQTFTTVTGLAGEGVSFESVVYPGMYLTLSGGVASLTDGSDAEACSFIIEEVAE